MTDIARAGKSGTPAGGKTRTGGTDHATVLGLIGGLAFVGLGVALGGSAAAFVDWPSVAIVFGGTAAITTVSFSLAEIAMFPAAFAKTLLRSGIGGDNAARFVLNVSDRIRRQGLLTFQIERAERTSLLNLGIGLLVDGAPVEEAERVMTAQLAATAQRHRTGVEILRKAAEVAPAMGLIGTLVGLVQMLGKLSDPASIGPAMAVALLTTFYGAILANAVFLPLAAKLERNSEHEALIGALHVTGIASIGRGENPRRLEVALNALLPPAQRVRVFD